MRASKSAPKSERTLFKYEVDKMGLECTIMKYSDKIIV